MFVFLVLTNQIAFLFKFVFCFVSAQKKIAHKIVFQFLEQTSAKKAGGFLCVLMEVLLIKWETIAAGKRKREEIHTWTVFELHDPCDTGAAVYQLSCHSGEFVE